MAARMTGQRLKCTDAKPDTWDVSEFTFPVELKNLSSELSGAFASAGPDELDGLLEDSLRRIAEMFRLDMFYCALVDDEYVTGYWEWAAPEAARVGRMSVGDTLEDAFASALTALQMGFRVAIDDVPGLSLAPERRARLADVASLLFSPVRREGVLVAVIGALVVTEPRAWTPDDGEHITYFGRLVVDSSGRSQQRSELALARARTRRIAEMLSDGLVTTDRSGRVTWSSPNIASIIGWSGESLQARRFADLVLAGDGTALDDQIDALRAGAAGGSARLRITTGSGEQRWFEVRPFLCQHDEVLPDELGLSITDVHERVLEAEDLITQATVDPLTGVMNRVGLRRVLDEIVDEHTPLALAFIDLDAFKPVNDRFGHDVGDQVLATIGARLLDLGHGSAVGRLGGDEFVIAFQHAGLDDVRPYVEDLRRVIEAPIRTDRGTVSITASIGIVWTPALSDVNGLIRVADDAMYVAKRRGGGHFEVVEQDRPGHPRADDHHTLSAPVA